MKLSRNKKVFLIVGIVIAVAAITVAAVFIGLNYSVQPLGVKELDASDLYNAGVYSIVNENDHYTVIVPENTESFDFNSIINYGYGGYTVSSSANFEDSLTNNVNLSEVETTFYIRNNVGREKTTLVVNLRRGDYKVRFIDYFGNTIISAALRNSFTIKLQDNGDIKLVGAITRSPDFVESNVMFKNWIFDDTKPICQDMDVYANWEIDDSIFEYTLDTTRNTYAISSITEYYSYVAIPSEHDGLPVTKICQDAFSLTSYAKTFTCISIPSSVIDIEPGAFEHAYDLKFFDVDKNNPVYSTSEDRTALLEYGHKLHSATKFFKKFPSNIATIGDRAFYALALTDKSFEVPNGVVGIGDYAFAYTNIDEIKLPNSLNEIGEYAFQAADFKEVVIPERITRIERGVFDNCQELRKVTMPSGLTSIGGSAFYNCNSLISITIPQNCSSIEDYAFGSCESLYEVVNLSNLTLTRYSTNNGRVAEYAMDIYTTSDYESKLSMDGDNVVYSHNGVISLLRVFVPSPAYYDSYVSVSIPDYITNVYSGAFAYGYHVKQLIIPKSVTSITDGAFLGCTMLEIIRYQGTKEEWNSISKGDNYLPTSGNLQGIYCTDGIIDL